MHLTIGASFPSHFCKEDKGIPAATEITSGRCFKEADSSRETDFTILGLTESSITSAPVAAIELSFVVLIPNFWFRRKSFSSVGPLTVIWLEGCPLSKIPPIKLVAILPPPINAIFGLLTRTSLIIKSVVCCYNNYLGPKIAEPTLIIVAPSWSAASRSDDIPMESVSSVVS